ncbi:hypothetical protein E2C01_062975 [Portunus trituberculatus]|uniref:Uncharacterized protein n=1 Tax=Portunus trituberculatus TaxID=210409 RepID=A0A5B7HFI1_PORTR|nr:hypothetical protein [Portunus trituberculatus]
MNVQVEGGGGGGGVDAKGLMSTKEGKSDILAAKYKAGSERREASESIKGGGEERVRVRGIEGKKSKAGNKNSRVPGEDNRRSKRREGCEGEQEEIVKGEVGEGFL